MNQLTKKSNFMSSFMRGGEFIACTVFIGVIAIPIGYISWHTTGMPNWAAFMMIGGSVASLWALWMFVLFGLACYFSHNVTFWRTLHPVNIALALFFGACYAAITYDKMPQVLISFTCGSVILLLCHRYLKLRPRTWLLLCLGVILSRYAVPWKYAGILAAGVAAFISGATWINWKSQITASQNHDEHNINHHDNISVTDSAQHHDEKSMP